MSGATKRLLPIPLALSLVGCPWRIGGPGGADGGQSTGKPTTAELCEVCGECVPQALTAGELSRARQRALSAIPILEAVRATSWEMAEELMIPVEDGAAGDLVLGEPLPVATLSTKDLERDGDVVSSLSEPTNQYVFPIHRDDAAFTVQSSVTVEKKRGEWQVSTIGRKHVVDRLFGVWLADFMAAADGDDNDATEVKPSVTPFLVDVPALYELYLARCRRDQLTLVPVFAPTVHGKLLDEMNAERSPIRGVADARIATEMFKLTREPTADSLDELVREYRDGNPESSLTEQEVRSSFQRVFGLPLRLADVLRELRTKAGWAPR